VLADYACEADTDRCFPPRDLLDAPGDLRIGSPSRQGRRLKKALKRTVARRERVYDSRNPRDHADLDPDRPRSSAKYYYYVRSNLSHRGKGAWKDGEIVRRSLLELQEIIRQVLAEQMGLGGELCGFR
jgi:hypothetical protein